MRFARVMAVIGVLAACSRPGEGADRVPFTLRVAAYMDLAPVSPVTRETLTMNLMSLVYWDLGTFFRSARQDGARVVLRSKAGGPMTNAQLAARIRHPLLVEARQTYDGIVIEMTTEAAAQSIDLYSPLVDRHLYEQTDYAPGRLVLRRSAPGLGPASVEALSMRSHEEMWRALLGRRVDLVPQVLPREFTHFADVPSLRVVPVKRPSTLGLVFSMSRVSDVRVRRAISLALGRQALAASVNGDRSNAAVVAEDRLQARALLAASGYHRGDRPLRLILHAGMEDRVRTAMAVQEQLAAVGLTVEPAVLPLDELDAALARGEFDLHLTTAGWELRYSYLYQTGSDANFGGYASPELDAAIDAGDEVALRAILERDLPSTPLFAMGEAVAVDASLCGVRPENVADLDWLADVHPCAPGERP